MGNQTDYFERVGYRGEYQIGDRVIGKWNKIPFVGTVGNDRLINNIDGPEITIHLDLTMKVDNVLKNFIIVKNKDVRRLKTIDLKEVK
jgi:hypothetical protein